MENKKELITKNIEEKKETLKKIEELKKQIEEIRNNFNKDCYNTLNNKRIEALR